MEIETTKEINICPACQGFKKDTIGKFYVSCAVCNGNGEVTKQRLNRWKKGQELKRFREYNKVTIFEMSEFYKTHFSIFIKMELGEIKPLQKFYLDLSSVKAHYSSKDKIGKTLKKNITKRKS